MLQTTPIEVRVEGISRLFDNLDPFPFPERDLDKNAEDYIVGWARELPRDQPIQIIIHIYGTGADTIEPQDVQSAIQKHFQYRAETVGYDLRELFRMGWLSATVGICVLAICVLLREVSLAKFKQEGISRFLSEGLLILGSVANWRPLQIFLYDWWPLTRRRNLYLRLSRAHVRVIARDDAGALSGSNITLLERNTA